MATANLDKSVTESEEKPHVVLSRKRRWVVTGGVLLGMFLAALEATVVGTAMPTIIASLGGMDRYSWVFSAYLLTSTVTVPIWGKLSDIYGRRPLYLAGIAVFLVGSALSGASQTMMQLILFRAIQGLGAGALVPLSLTINGDIFTLKERTRIQGLFSGVWGLASILGPLAGGFITENVSWRWVFYINIPFGLAAAAVVGVALAEPKRTKHPIVDYAGAAWLTIAITLLLIALNESANPTLWTSAVMIVPLIGFVLFGALFVWTERRAVEPIVPLTLFRNPMVGIGSITNFLIGTAMFGSLAFIPLFVQGTRGGTPTEAGQVLTPFLLAWVTMAIIGGKLMLRFGYRPTVLSGLAVLLIGFVWITTFDSHTPIGLLLVAMGMMGAGMGLVMLALLVTMQNSVSRSQLGIATSLQQFSRSIGGAVGVAVMGAVMTVSLMSHLSEIQDRSGLPQAQVENLLHNINDLMRPDSRAGLPPSVIAPMSESLASALHNAFIVGAIFAGLGLLSGLLLPAKPVRHSDEPPAAVQEALDSTAECERLLMAEMTTIDAAHEPAIAEGEAVVESQ